MLQKMLGPKAKAVSEVDTITDWAYTCDRMAGEGFLLAGDAACFLDPLLSTGVSMAMLAGYSAAVTTNTILQTPALEDRALASCSDGVSHCISLLRRQRRPHGSG